jgi:hypothetical protein
MEDSPTTQKTKKVKLGVIFGLLCMVSFLMTVNATTIIQTTRTQTIAGSLPLTNQLSNELVIDPGVSLVRDCQENYLPDRAPQWRGSEDPYIVEDGSENNAPAYIIQTPVLIGDEITNQTLMQFTRTSLGSAENITRVVNASLNFYGADFTYQFIPGNFSATANVNFTLRQDSQNLLALEFNATTNEYALSILNATPAIVYVPVVDAGWPILVTMHVYFYSQYVDLFVNNGLEIVSAGASVPWFIQNSTVYFQTKLLANTRLFAENWNWFMPQFWTQMGASPNPAYGIMNHDYPSIIDSTFDESDITTFVPIATQQATLIPLSNFVNATGVTTQYATRAITVSNTPHLEDSIKITKSYGATHVIETIPQQMNSSDTLIVRGASTSDISPPGETTVSLLLLMNTTTFYVNLTESSSPTAHHAIHFGVVGGVEFFEFTYYINSTWMLTFGAPTITHAHYTFSLGDTLIQWSQPTTLTNWTIINASIHVEFPYSVSPIEQSFYLLQYEVISENITLPQISSDDSGVYFYPAIAGYFDPIYPAVVYQNALTQNVALDLPDDHEQLFHEWTFDPVNVTILSNTFQANVEIPAGPPKVASIIVQGENNVTLGNNTLIRSVRIPANGRFIILLNARARESIIVSYTIEISVTYRIFAETNAFSTFLDQVFQLIAPLIILVIFPLVFYSATKKTLFALIGFAIGSIVLFIAGMVDIAAMIILLVISVGLFIAFFKLQDRSVRE